MSLLEECCQHIDSVQEETKGQNGFTFGAGAVTKEIFRFCRDNPNRLSSINVRNSLCRFKPDEAVGEMVGTKNRVSTFLSVADTQRWGEHLQEAGLVIPDDDESKARYKKEPELVTLQIPDYVGDEVNSPPHYNQGDIECIDAIRAALGRDFIGFLHGSTLKYIWRFRYKGKPEQDLNKAAWYLDALRDEVSKEYDGE